MSKTDLVILPYLCKKKEKSFNQLLLLVEIDLMSHPGQFGYNFIYFTHEHVFVDIMIFK